MAQIDLSKAVALREPKEIYALRLTTWDIEFDSGSKKIPVVLANPQAVLCQVVEQICLDKEAETYLKINDEVILISIAPTIDGTSGRDRPEKVCSCYIPAYSSPLAYPHLMLPANKLMIVEGYDEFGHDFSHERADLVYDQMVSRSADNKLIVISAAEKDVV